MSAAASRAQALLLVGIVAATLEAATLVAWVAGGAHMVTQYQVATVVVEEDEFGDSIERTVMVDQFRFGLLPDKFYDGAILWLVLFGGIGPTALILRSRALRASNPS